MSATKREDLQNFRNMVENGEWQELLKEASPQSVKRELELLCHAALRSRNSMHAAAFLDALFAKAPALEITPEQAATLAQTRERAHTVDERRGWLAVENDQTQPEQVAQPFPRGVFPPMLERYLDSAAENVQVDRAMIGAAMLAACALCLQGRCKIAYPSGSGHDEQLCLYLVIVGSPGERKSSAFNKAVLPVRKWQETRREEYKQELVAYETACKIKAKHAEAMERQLGEKNLTDEKRQRLEEDLTALALKQKDSTPPISPEILATDTTVEALSNLMELTGETAGIFSDEADFLKILAGLYNSGKAGNLQLPLQAYDGSSFFRQRGGGTVFLKRPLLSVCLYAQPALYEEIRSNSDLQGRGMIGRLLFCVPEETMPKIPWTPEAAKRMLDYLQQLENSMQSGMPMESAKDYASKAGGVANRIAGILHMLWTRDAAKPVTLDTAEKAIQLHTYFFAQKLEAMEQEETREERLESVISKKLAALTLAEGRAYTTVSRLQRKVKNISGLRTARELEPFLEAMESKNWIEVDQQSKNKRRLYISPYFEA